MSEHGEDSDGSYAVDAMTDSGDGQDNGDSDDSDDRLPHNDQKSSSGSDNDDIAFVAVVSGDASAAASAAAPASSSSAAATVVAHAFQVPSLLAQTTLYIPRNPSDLRCIKFNANDKAGGQELQLRWTLVRFVLSPFPSLEYLSSSQTHVRRNKRRNKAELKCEWTKNQQQFMGKYGIENDSTKLAFFDTVCPRLPDLLVKFVDHNYNLPMQKVTRNIKEWMRSVLIDEVDPYAEFNEQDVRCSAEFLQQYTSYAYSDTLSPVENAAKLIKALACHVRSREEREEREE